jgi:hypothetical protein
MCRHGAEPLHTSVLYALDVCERSRSDLCLFVGCRSVKLTIIYPRNGASLEPQVTRRSKAWTQEGIEPKATVTLGAFEIRRLFTLCLELILSSSKASGRFILRSEIVSLMRGTGRPLKHSR